MNHLKSSGAPHVSFLSADLPGHVKVVRRSDGEKFICLIAPINLTEEELNIGETEPDSGDGI